MCQQSVEGSETRLANSRVNILCLNYGIARIFDQAERFWGHK